MRNRVKEAAAFVVAILIVASVARSANAQDIELPAPDGKIVIPSSSIVRAEDIIAQRAHTNIVLYIHTDNTQPGPTFETPASIACVYHLVPQVSGCPISGTTTNPTGGSGAIALVAAYDYPTAANDLAVFSSRFGLPPANLTVVYATGTKPPPDPFSGQWDAEQALDIEWAHAMAPKAKIYLVQAASQSLSDLLTAEQVASTLVAAAGGGEVSNSWGYPEQSSYTFDDSYFSTPGVVYFASSGDAAFSLIYPSVSPSVIAAGGTSLQRNASGYFTGESYWDNIYGGGGGGLSATESRPSYQNVITSIVGTHRGVPDISSDADPLTGVAVYDSTPLFGQPPGWLQIGGTSVSSPTLAGIANAAGAADTSASLVEIYTDYASPTEYSAEYRDIKLGNTNCKVGWDICTGVGSPLAYKSLAAPDFSLTLTPIWVNKFLINGFKVGVRAADQFNGTVALRCNLPGGVCSLNPTSIVGSGTSLMTGSHYISQWDGVTVTGTSGGLTHTVQFTYEPPPPPCNPKPCQ
jgi:subtilase family serine protease